MFFAREIDLRTTYVPFHCWHDQWMQRQAYVTGAGHIRKKDNPTFFSGDEVFSRGRRSKNKT
jgi:hypothetical protein